MKYPLLFLVPLLFLFSCRQSSVNESIYSENYQVGKIPGIESFRTYNKYDKAIDSIAPLAQTLAGLGGFKKNRSRIFMNSYSNGKPATQDTVLYTGMPTPCYSGLDKDTIYIKAGIGFFGGMGIEIKIVKRSFQSDYFLYASDAKPYKYSPKDSAFTGQLSLRSRFQNLILNEQPTFKPGQQLTGYLTFTSPFYYENDAGTAIDTNYVKGKLYFTCNIE